MYSNESKRQRAIAACGTDATEAEIKAKYLELGGLYVEETGAAEHMTTDDTGSVSSDQAEAEEAPKPKGRTKK